MKILAIKPLDTGVYKDIFEMFCEGLEKHFRHTVIRVPWIEHKNKISAWKYFDIEKLKNADLVWSPFEPLLPVAFHIKRNHNIPIVGHFEVIPTDVNLDYVDFLHVRKASLKPVFYNQKHADYKTFFDMYNDCDVKTYVDDYTMFLIERLGCRKLNKDKTFLQPYPFDNEMMEKFIDKKIKEKRQIISTFRLVEHKKAHHVITALSLMKNPPKYVIVGSGYYQMTLEKLATDLGVEVEFVGMVNDETKAKLIQESMLSVNPWAWIPTAESSFFKKPSIVYDAPDTHNKLRDMPIYVRNNDVIELSKTIEHYVNNDADRFDAGEKAFKELSEGRTDVLFQKEACKVLNNIFKEAKK